MTHEEQQIEKLREWYKFRLFSVDPLDEKKQGAIFRYMIRELSRGRVPKFKFIQDTWDGKPVPICGYINCGMPDDGEHVH